MILLLNILKIIGIILLCILGLLLLVIMLLLFIPIRYRLKANRKSGDEVTVRADVKLSWFFHFFSASFRYPEQTYFKIKLFGIPVFSTEKKENATQKKPIKDKSNKQSVQSAGQSNEQPDVHSQTVPSKVQNEVKEEDLEKKLEEEIEEPTVLKFVRKLWERLKNIKYTILQIYDKIKHVIKNIRYYLAVIQSNCFKRTFSMCKTELFSLLQIILPKKITGDFTVGTGDPASTAQILAIHGMLYPLIGNHINIIPDFENTVIEGDLFLKGKITLFKVLKTAIKVYFNKDLHKVIRLLKREAA